MANEQLFVVALSNNGTSILAAGVRRTRGNTIRECIKKRLEGARCLRSNVHQSELYQTRVAMKFRKI